MTRSSPPSPEHLGPSVVDAIVRRAYAEVQEGRFEATRDALLPYSGQGDHRVDLLLGFAYAGSRQFDLAAPLLVNAALANVGAKHPAHDVVELFARFDMRPDAERAVRAMLALTPEDARIHDALGDVLCQMGRFDDAIGVLEHGLRLRPYNPLTLNLMAIARAERGETETALAMFQSVLKLTPNNASALSNLACLLSALNRPEEALDLYRSAIAEKPTDAQIRLNHSVALLKAGRFAQGWSEHEWRLKLPNHTSLPQDKLLPPIGPDVDIRGKRILITQEEGLGDTLMYLRFIPALARRGAITHLWVPDSLEHVCRRVEGVAIVQVGGDVPPFDWHCPFISLPRALVGTPDAMGDPVPYLSADPTKVAEKSRLLPRNGKLNVGLVWGGSPRPHHTPAHMVDRKRSASLAAMAPLAAVEGVNLISLQKGPYAREAFDPPEGMRLYDPTDELHDMDDTAALMMGLDVLVSVDTSVVHLAGALGRRVLLMDRFDNCWRWLSGREDSVWYPDLTIIRQDRLGDWSPVVERVGVALRKMVAERQSA
ncbi:O-linked N-acetylglucosamine transferase [Acetobacter nitrogenifigens DSM 23921 = NBRC 105050]|uniref:Uncharacterized protein n=1 Tax=Acetobacter nitrogenifigens DSM 23921 = NBRC 105050 TaxID=1120919 RepID=A0A511XDB8_9PROT|nr:tetratricopeptide repeat protein [Acetobacter nitrogenifigens]GBQ89928.1 O-linked N-acetylglucosamine transferase [Acetobacter nitrogenifigens DSM 23921 = NBRC 105050]GEN60950.1 hypothetical protein ANI02nite_28340 [Acetobacter nitrogenifigens DSM 23921 = NBRC 105050]